MMATFQPAALPCHLVIAAKPIPGSLRSRIALENRDPPGVFGGIEMMEADTAFQKPSAPQQLAPPYTLDLPLLVLLETQCVYATYTLQVVVLLPVAGMDS